VGLLPVPIDVAGQARPIIARQVERLRESGDDSGMLEVMQSIQQALSGDPVPLGKGKKRIVVDRVTVDRGTLEIVGHQAGRDMTPAPAMTPTE
jgi:hypothetical protein